MWSRNVDGKLVLRERTIRNAAASGTIRQIERVRRRVGLYIRSIATKTRLWVEDWARVYFRTVGVV